jgi:hypothetical protein
MNSSQSETGPFPPACHEENTALKQSQLINPLDLLMCCVTLTIGGESREKQETALKSVGTLQHKLLFLFHIPKKKAFSPAMNGLGTSPCPNTTVANSSGRGETSDFRALERSVHRGT